MGLFNIHIHHHYHTVNDKLIIKNLSKIMANIQELTAQVTQLQADLDVEQQQVALAGA